MPNKGQKSATFSGEDLKHLQHFYARYKIYCSWNNLPDTSFAHFVAEMATVGSMVSIWYKTPMKKYLYKNLKKK